MIINRRRRREKLLLLFNTEHNIRQIKLYIPQLGISILKEVNTNDANASSYLEKHAKRSKKVITEIL